MPGAPKGRAFYALFRVGRPAQQPPDISDNDRNDDARCDWANNGIHLVKCFAHRIARKAQ